MQRLSAALVSAVAAIVAVDPAATEAAVFTSTGFHPFLQTQSGVQTAVGSGVFAFPFSPTSSTAQNIETVEISLRSCINNTNTGCVGTGEQYTFSMGGQAFLIPNLGEPNGATFTEELSLFPSTLADLKDGAINYVVGLTTSFMSPLTVLSAVDTEATLTVTTRDVSITPPGGGGMSPVPLGPAGPFLLGALAVAAGVGARRRA